MSRSFKITKLISLTRRCRQRVKYVNYEIKNFIDRCCRKLLFLGPDTEFDWIGDGGLVDSDKLEESIKNSIKNFHNQPRREYYLDQTLRFFFYKAPDKFGDVRRFVEN